MSKHSRQCLHSALTTPEWNFVYNHMCSTHFTFLCGNDFYDQLLDNTSVPQTVVRGVNPVSASVKGSKCVGVIPHQTQQTANFVDGSYTAEKAHGHWQGPYSNEDVRSHFDSVWWFFCKRNKNRKSSEYTEPQKPLKLTQLYLTVVSV